MSPEHFAGLLLGLFLLSVGDDVRFFFFVCFDADVLERLQC